MDDLMTLRAVRDDIDAETCDLSPSELDRLRARALSGLGGSPTSHARWIHRPPLRRRWLSAAAAAVAAIVAGVVLIQSPTGQPAAAAALDRAAQLETTNTQGEPGRGRYLKASVLARNLEPVMGQSGPSVVSGWAWRASSAQLYVPADTAGDWVAVNDCPTFTAATFSTPSAANSLAAAERLTECPTRAVSSGGAFDGEPLGDDPLRPSARFLASLPRQPAALLERLQAAYDPSMNAPKDYMVWRFVTVLLDAPLSTPELRGSALRALALLPGTRLLTPVHAPDGRVVTAVTTQDDGKYADSILIDPATGALVGTSTVLLVEDQGIPADTAIAVSTVRREIVEPADVPKTIPPGRPPS